MCTYEFAEVDLDCGRCPPAVALPDALFWKPISDEAGQNMLQLKRAKVHASTDRLCQDAKHPNKPKTYLFVWSMPITSCGDAHPAVTPMVKYIHCSRGHAILVRKASELEVEVTTTDLGTVPTPDGEMQLVKVVATVGTATVWDKHIAKTDTPQKLSLVAHSIRATIAVQGKATLQSKILWKVQGRRTTVAKQILKKKAYPH
jgi:hypothetical protein